MRTIDADAHVIETPQTFDFLDESERKYAPILVMGSGGDRETKRIPDHWLVERRVLMRENVMRNIDESSREMPPQRLGGESVARSLDDVTQGQRTFGTAESDHAVGDEARKPVHAWSSGLGQRSLSWV